jgi:hypothetical protein
MKTPVEMKKENYTITVNYSPEAIEKKIMKFTTKSGDVFEISAEEMATILVGQVNSETISATFVESEKMHVVEVTRQLKCRAVKDFKKGDEIRLEYKHPYPVEFAVIEEAIGLAKINKEAKAFEITKEYLESVQKKTLPEQKRFVDHFYKFFKSLGKKN